MFFLLKRYHCIAMVIIFVTRKEHHKRKYQWGILKPGQGQYNKKEGELKKQQIPCYDVIITSI